MVPSYAQSAPPAMTGVWAAGPGAVGPDTYIGVLESPRAGANVKSGASVLVSGWAADTTSSCWSGFDQVQVYAGDRTNGGTKLANGTVGLNRPDVGDAFGGNSGTAGFVATVPASALAPGQPDLFVYLHTPNKGWWYKDVSLNVSTQAGLQYPTDPIVVWTNPCCGEQISSQQFGATQEYVLAGYALTGIRSSTRMGRRRQTTRTRLATGTTASR
ncbi:MAG: hypothetical protein JO057_04670 [Chloroflexi bacterium]|nr:hypothetical protein [Chloroflexota bacterium]